MDEAYLCRCCNHRNVPKNERGGGHPYHPYFGGFLCSVCRENIRKPHTHTLNHFYVKECPACNPSQRGLDE
jgi:hypothetical protein